MMKHHVKFGENPMNSSKVIKVLVKFKMVAGCHLGSRISGFRDGRSLLEEVKMLKTKFGANRMNRSEIIPFSSIFPVSSAAILDFEK